MRITRTNIVLFIFSALLYFRAAECISCVQCNHAANPSECNTIIQCPDNHTCFIESKLDSTYNRVYYDLGCRPLVQCMLQTCSKVTTPGKRTPTTIGDLGLIHESTAEVESKRQTPDMVLCSECCYESNCNIDKCGFVSSSNLTKCYDCTGVYDGSPVCTKTVPCDLTTSICSVTISHASHSLHPGAHDLGCSNRMLCDLLVNVPDDQKDPLARCCDKFLCNTNPYKNVSIQAPVSPPPCPTAIVQTTPTTTTQKTAPTTTSCYDCQDVYKGGPVCNTTTPCDLSTSMCTVLLHRRSIHPNAYDLKCSSRKQCNLLMSLPAGNMDPNIKCCDTFLCNENPHISTTGHAQGASNVCNVDGTCSWIQGETDTMEWHKMSGHTQSPDTGPDNDHTFGNANGAYYYIEASSPSKQGDYADLVSPTMSSNTTRCLEFWYSMYGDGIGTLNVTVQAVGRKSTTLFTLAGNQGVGWKKSTTTIQAFQYDYNIVITGTVGSTYHGDIGIDDIVITTGICHGAGNTPHLIG